MDGRIHVIDGFGNDVLPDQPEIRSSYDVTYAKDGSLILVQDINRNYHIYKVTRGQEQAENLAVTENETDETQPGKPVGPDDQTGETQLEEIKEEAKEEPETWTCENGHAGNTGKFCSECGAPKPVAEDDGTWTCANGHEGNTGKFCTECGSPKPEK